MAASAASALVIPDSLLAKEATEILREYSTTFSSASMSTPSRRQAKA